MDLITSSMKFISEADELVEEDVGEEEKCQRLLSGLVTDPPPTPSKPPVCYQRRKRKEVKEISTPICYHRRKHLEVGIPTPPQPLEKQHTGKRKRTQFPLAKKGNNRPTKKLAVSMSTMPQPPEVKHTRNRKKTQLTLAKKGNSMLTKNLGVLTSTPPQPLEVKRMRNRKKPQLTLANNGNNSPSKKLVVSMSIPPQSPEAKRTRKRIKTKLPLGKKGKNMPIKKVLVSINFKLVKSQEELHAFHRQVDFFIEVMHRIQGDRRFTQWKGSVVDAIVGAFLTQNVSDNFSSDAFMLLAAQFPVQPGSNLGHRFYAQKTMNSLGEQETEDNMAMASDIEDLFSLPDKACNRRTTDRLEINRKDRKDGKVVFDWDSLRKDAYGQDSKRERSINTMDAIDYEALRNENVTVIANVIKGRGMNKRLANRIKDFLNRVVRDHGSIDLEWLKDVPADEAKEYLLSIYGLGLKSVECIRLLTLHQPAFPVDTNVARVAVRLGWVPLQPLPEPLQLDFLDKYSAAVQVTIQKYLWPLLQTFDLLKLYELHYQMITFGKVFCTKSKPNCNACPMRAECPSAKILLKEASIPTPNLNNVDHHTMSEHDVADIFSKEASVPMPKLKKTGGRPVSEHEVYVLSDSHHLLNGRDIREPDDPCPYLLAILTPEESTQPPERCSDESNNICEKGAFTSSSSIPEVNSQTVRGTLLIPSRTAMRGSFPLNGTYFQVNEVFADHESSICPMHVPRDSLSNLQKSTVYFGSSVATIFKGLSRDEIQCIFWRGYVCTRGFDHISRAPRALQRSLHFTHSRLKSAKTD